MSPSKQKLGGLRKRESGVSQRIGLALDRVSVSTIVLTFLVGLILFGVAFYVLSRYGQGIVSASPDNHIDIGTAMYFSVVTISSLGYGDYHPVGFGRLLSVIEVLYGLSIIAVIIAKVAGQRQSLVNRLIYQSVQEQHILSFINETEACRVWLGKWMWGEITPTTNSIHHTIGSAKFQVGTIQNFVAQQIGTSMLSEVDLDQSFYLLFKNLTTISHRALRIAKQNTLSNGERELLAGLAYVCRRTIGRYAAAANEVKIQKMLDKANQDWRTYLKIRKHLPTCRTRHRNSPKLSTEEQKNILERVAACLPAQPWSKNVHKDVAKSLGISNRAAHRAISELINTRRFRHQWRGKLP